MKGRGMWLVDMVGSELIRYDSHPVVSLFTYDSYLVLSLFALRFHNAAAVVPSSAKATR